MLQDKEAIGHLVAEVLDGTELRLSMDAYTLAENFENGQVNLECEVHDKRTGERQVISSVGVGIVDAFYRGLIRIYSPAFPSLTTLRFADFAVHAKLDTAHDASRTDSIAEVVLRVANSEGQEVAFTHTSPSIIRSSMQAVLQSIEFFINSERAFIEVYRALDHARHSGRADSIARYTQQLAILVQATSYSEVIDQIRAAELNKP